MIGLFSAGGFMPHGMCYLWQPGIMAVHAISDGLIGVSYVAIAAMLVAMVARLKRDVPFPLVFVAFGAFIVACGMTHLLDVWTLWHPVYWLSGGVKVVTAMASLATALVLPSVVPQAVGTIREAKLSRARQEELEATIAELRESESRFRQAFENAPIGKGLVALDGRWLRVNRSLCELTGYTEEELLGMTYQQLTHPEDLDADQAEARRLAAGEIGSYQLEKRYIRKDGRVVTVQLVGSVVRDQAGEPLYFIAQVLDLTERLQVLKRERQLVRAEAAREEAEAATSRMEFLARASTVLASSLDYEATLRSLARLVVPVLGDYCVVDVLEDDGEMRRVAAAHADPARQELAEALRSHPPRPGMNDHPVLRAVQSAEPFVADPIETVAPDWSDADGALIAQLETRSIMAVPLLLRGSAFGAITIGLDRRSDRHFEAADRALAEEIARRAAVAVEHGRAFQLAEEANRAKADFLAVMSHELRTPLNAVVGYTDLLQAGVPGPLTEQQATFLDRIGRSASHLLSLIEEVLTFARLEAGRETVRREPIELDDIVRQASALIEPLAAERGLHFEVHVPETSVRLETDARKVRQMLANLLSNAVKFTEWGEVTLTASSSDGHATFEVRDTGIGIAPQHLERIFEPFWQVDSATTRRAEGTGLGLGVTRRLARLLGGDVTVRSQPGAGSVFTLRLPVSADART